MRADFHDKNYLLWDRILADKAFELSTKVGGKEKKLTLYDEVYIGHTTTQTWGFDTPFCGGGVWCLDQGAGFKGKLTIMDTDTKQYWQSDSADILYPDTVKWVNF